MAYFDQTLLIRQTKSIFLTILISSATVTFASTVPPVKTDQVKVERCKFNDLTCQQRIERPVTRKLKRLSRF